MAKHEQNLDDKLPPHLVYIKQQSLKAIQECYQKFFTKSLEDEIAEHIEDRPDVAIYYNDENGDWVYAVTLIQDPDYWLSAFTTIEEAQAFCDSNELKVIWMVHQSTGKDLISSSEESPMNKCIDPLRCPCGELPELVKYTRGWCVLCRRCRRQEWSFDRRFAVTNWNLANSKESATHAIIIEYIGDEVPK